ncbi:MAG: ABC transporter ATP-binding protein [Acidimicrobiales bacterium]|nr:ABC transporter ATP-binding protein [Acidimicrobiales bacterium]
MAGDGPALELDGLHKVFGDLVAVDHLDLTVPAGSFFGLVGRNGAGKTTTLRMCTALLRPDDGSVRIDGVDVWADPQEAKRRMGVMPESMDVFDRLTGAELLLYDGLLRGMDRDLVVERSTELLDVLELTDAAARTVADYSHGMTKKIVLAAALLHGPSVLFLDEPFEAIDPVSTRTIEAVLRRHVDQGGTVVFSSHVLDVVERLCDHLAVIDHGTVRASGTIEEVRAGRRLEDAFMALIGVDDADTDDLTWLGTSSD